MTTVVPFDASEPKTRLEPFLDAEERAAFARAMLRDVLDALVVAGREPTVLATESIGIDPPTGVRVTVDDRPLTPAVNDRIAAADAPVAVVMADLPLVTPRAVDRLFAPGADVVLAPGLGGGTNAILARHPAFRVDYHGVSYRDHREQAADLGTVAAVDSWRLSVDIDERADLAEVLLHTDGEAAAWLSAAGVRVAPAGTRARSLVERAQEHN